MGAIVGIAERAGFPWHALAEAAAVAWTASQGDDQAETPAAGARDRLVGLWGVPVAHGDLEGATVALMSPQTNAAAALRLWRANGRTWDWTPVTTWSDYPGALAAAQAVVRGGRWLQTSGPFDGHTPTPGDVAPGVHTDWTPIGDLQDTARAITELLRET